MYDFDRWRCGIHNMYGLFALRHRGQELRYCSQRDGQAEGEVTSYKGMGLVNEVSPRRI